jgi:hypothetical protein
MYKEIDTDSTVLPKWVAARDVQQRNATNRKLYNEQQQQTLLKFYELVCAAYNCRVFYNYREQFMVVKVERPSKVNLLAREVRELDYYAAQNNIDIVRTKNNILYRIKQ